MGGEGGRLSVMQLRRKFLILALTLTLNLTLTMLSFTNHRKNVDWKFEVLGGGQIERDAVKKTILLSGGEKFIVYVV